MTYTHLTTGELVLISSYYHQVKKEHTLRNNWNEQNRLSIANGYKEKNDKQAFKRTIHQRHKDYQLFNNDLRHLEGDTIVGKGHKSAVITLIERLSKVIITLKPIGRRA